LFIRNKEMNKSTREALSALAHYIEITGQEDGLFMSNMLGKFYVDYPSHRGIVNKKMIEKNGSHFGLTWKSNAPKVDEIVYKKAKKLCPTLGNNAGGVSSAPRATPPSPTLQMSVKKKQEVTPQPSYSTMFVEAVESAACIMKKLSAVSEFALDIEGDLSKNGQLSLIQIGAKLKPNSNSISVHIFDILSCPDIMTEGGLADLLMHTGITKVIHDCRRDSEALLCQHGVELCDVFDTQAAHSMLDIGPNAGRRQGLNVVLDKYAGVMNDLKGKVEHRPGLWEQRPLPDELLSYAAQDVAFMLKAYQEMSSQLENIGKLDQVLENSRANLRYYGVQQATLASSNIDTDLPPMGLLPTAKKGTSKYVRFDTDGSHHLFDDPFDDATGEVTAAVAPDSGSDLEDLKKLIDVLPPDIIKAFYGFPLYPHTTEVVLDVGRRPLVRYMENSCSNDDEMPLCSGSLHCDKVSSEHLTMICENSQLGKFSSDNRAGLSSTLHRISRKLNRNNEIIGLTMRIGRMVKGSTEMITDIVASNRSVLLLGIPGGKPNSCWLPSVFIHCIAFLFVLMYCIKQLKFYFVCLYLLCSG
jgi:hypothetical protein